MPSSSVPAQPRRIVGRGRGTQDPRLSRKERHNLQGNENGNKESVTRLSEIAPAFQSWSEIPHIPATDNEPGAPEALLKANARLHGRQWPSPYVRTRHEMILGDARDLRAIPNESVHLVVTSPPYFNLKPYASDAGGRQLGRIDNYEAFLDELDRVWRECERVLVPGGRICCVIGDILIPRRRGGRHRVLPLPSDIQIRSRNNGLDNLTPILWFKIGNRTNEAGGGSSAYYGKPYQPGAIIKNDHEHILMIRKPGGYRTTPMIQKALSMLQREEIDAWMRPVWSDIVGSSLRAGDPAPFPAQIAERLVRMFSFAGDTVLDPFAGSGSGTIAAIRTGRNSISVEIEEEYLNAATRRAVREAGAGLAGNHTAVVIGSKSEPTKSSNQVSCSSRIRCSGSTGNIRRRQVSASIRVRCARQPRYSGSSIAPRTRSFCADVPAGRNPIRPRRPWRMPGAPGRPHSMRPPTIGNAA
jgi:site-specific DNA-methyltransferase (adenine-specific)